MATANQHPGQQRHHPARGCARIQRGRLGRGDRRQSENRLSFYRRRSRAGLAQGGDVKIINVASVLSFQRSIRVASYAASKSVLAGLARLLACEWAGKGINVNAIAPGYFATRNTAILVRIPASHCEDPDELHGAAVFLASKAADYVHRVTLPVDGGWLARRAGSILAMQFDHVAVSHRMIGSNLLTVESRMTPNTRESQ